MVILITIFMFLAVGLGYVSWKKTGGGGHVWYADHHLKGSCKYKPSFNSDRDWMAPVSANLRSAELTRKPSNWLPYEVWLEDWREAFGRREQIDLIDQGHTQMARRFRIETKKRWEALTGSLDAPDIRYPDLRSADIAFAFLSGSSFLCADMRGITAHWARLEGADLSTAILDDAYLYKARMEGANLSYSMARRATFSAARLQGAEFAGARMQGIDLRVAHLDGADLSGTYMHCANLSGALMDGADLSAARLKGANLRSADLSAALNLEQKQVNEAYGDSGTQLPSNIDVPAHWDDEIILWYERDRSYVDWLGTVSFDDSDDQDDVCPSR